MPNLLKKLSISPDTLEDMAASTDRGVLNALYGYARVRMRELLAGKFKQEPLGDALGISGARVNQFVNHPEEMLKLNTLVELAHMLGMTFLQFVQAAYDWDAGLKTTEDVEYDARYPHLVLATRLMRGLVSDEAIRDTVTAEMKHARGDRSVLEWMDVIRATETVRDAMGPPSKELEATNHASAAALHKRTRPSKDLANLPKPTRGKRQK